MNQTATGGLSFLFRQQEKTAARPYINNWRDIKVQEARAWYKAMDLNKNGVVLVDEFWEWLHHDDAPIFSCFVGLSKAEVIDLIDGTIVDGFLKVDGAVSFSEFFG